MADFAGRPAVAADHRQHLQRRDQAVAGGGEVGQDDVAGLLAADIEAVLAHMLADIAVADRRARQRQAVAAEIALQAEIGHDGGDDAVPAQPPVLVPGGGDHRHQLVAVDDAALLVDEDDAVGVAVERDAEIGAHLVHLARQRLRARSSRRRG